MAATIKPATMQQWLVTLKGLDFYWQNFSGIKDTADTAEYNDGLSYRKYKMVGPRALDTMDLEKAFDPIADKPIIAWHKTYCDNKGSGTTISVVPITYCPQVEPLGPTLIIYNCRPINLEGFQVDKTSNNMSMLKLTFIADDWEYQ